MRYPDFRAQGLFVGSGVVEAGCKEVIGSPLKRSGMFWTVRGANALIALRCCRLNASAARDSQNAAGSPFCRAPDTCGPEAMQPIASASVGNAFSLFALARSELVRNGSRTSVLL
jgi:hypothetical protein